jgi:hypothetical protein
MLLTSITSNSTPVTLDIYCHTTPHMQQQAAAAMNAALSDAHTALGPESGSDE